MSLDDNKALAQRAVSLWVSGTKDDPGAFVTADYRNHQESDIHGGVQVLGLAELRGLLKEFHAAFSEVRIASHMRIAEGDLVATRVEMEARHTGSLVKETPTGKVVTWTGVEIVRIADGKVAESWADWDKYGMFQQIGLLP